MLLKPQVQRFTTDIIKTLKSEYVADVLKERANEHTAETAFKAAEARAKRRRTNRDQTYGERESKRVLAQQAKEQARVKAIEENERKGK
jgi:hypothetical protein